MSDPTTANATPQAILEIAWAFSRTRVLISAVDLDLFTHIEEGCHTAEEIAQAAGAPVRGVRMLLDALAAMSLLQKASGRYGLTEASGHFLRRNSPNYLGGLVRHIDQIEANWMKLTATVRTGRPAVKVESGEDQGEFFSQFVGSLYALNAPAAEAVARHVLEQFPEGRIIRVLDIGAGSGVWGFAFAKLNSRVFVTVADWPKVIESVTKAVARRQAVEGQVDYLPGNFRETVFPEGRYDVVILGHICHSEGAQNTARLLASARRALQPEGQVVIAEWTPDPQRAEAQFPLLFAVNMLVHTESGDTFTFEEYRNWLEEAGFQDVTQVDIPAPSPLIVARRKAAATKAA
jgi:ubiquinone/menaquinone biosynthesis C-methylase UbiE